MRSKEAPLRTHDVWYDTEILFDKLNGALPVFDRCPTETIESINGNYKIVTADCGETRGFPKTVFKLRSRSKTKYPTRRTQTSYETLYGIFSTMRNEALYLTYKKLRKILGKLKSKRIIVFIKEDRELIDQNQRLLHDFHIHVCSAPKALKRVWNPDEMWANRYHRYELWSKWQT